MEDDGGRRATRKVGLPLCFPFRLGRKESRRLQEEISLCFLQPSQSKSAFKSLPAPGASLPSPLPSPLMELSCPEHGPGSLLRYRGGGGGGGALEGSRILETPCQYPFQTGAIACSSCSTEAFWGALAPGEFRPEDGTTLAPPPPLGKFCQIGKAEGGAVPARGCGSIKPHLLTPGQSVTTLGFGDFLLPCSPRPCLLSECGEEGNREIQV